MIAAEVARALGGHRDGKWWSCRCPAHDDRSPSLSLCDGGRGLIVHCHAGCRRDEVVAQLHRFGLLDRDAAAPIKPVDPAEMERRRVIEERDRRRIADILDFWQCETDPVRPGSAVERYWMSRNLALPIPQTIRASRSWLRHPEGGGRPAMVALVEHVADGPVAIHRTWLAVDGSAKAAFRDARRALGPVKGGAVRFAPAGEPAHAARGVAAARPAIRFKMVAKQ